jgi:hypothetical protein
VSAFVVEIVPAFVVEMVPAAVVEIVPAEVVEIVPFLLVVEMVPPRALDVTATRISADERASLMLFMVFLL